MPEASYIYISKIKNLSSWNEIVLLLFGNYIGFCFLEQGTATRNIVKLKKPKNS
jgi:hypothetical protein